MEPTPTPPQPDPSRPASDPVEPLDQEELEERLDQLGAQYQFLEVVFALVVSALILLCVGVDLYIYKQTRLARGQAYRQRLLILPALDSFRNEREPLIRSFISKLQSFAATYPDFKPILDRYRTELGAYFVAPPPSLQSAPADTNPPAPSP